MESKTNTLKIEEIEKKIKELERQEQTAINKLMINTLIEKRDELKEKIQEESKTERIKDLIKKKEELKNQLEEQRERGNIKEYERLKNEIWKINKLLREKKREIKFLSFEQIEKILKVLKNDKREVSFLYEVMILTAFEGACRPSELLEIRTLDLDLKENTLFIRRLKGSNDTRIYLSKKLNAKFKKLLKNQSKDKLYLFENNGKKYEVSNFRRIFQRICKKANIPKELQKLHSLRHSRAVLGVQKGANLNEVKYLLGHKDLKNTMVYLQYVPNEIEIIKLYEKINNETD